MTTLCRWESSSRTCWKRTTRREECVFMWTRIRCRWSSARRAPGRRRLLLKFSFLGDFLPARLRCRGYRTVVPASQPDLRVPSSSVPSVDMALDDIGSNCTLKAANRDTVWRQ
nr:PREDICTED: uncharacterized protein LOC103564333 isoform X2 [Equus przewalskii]